MQKEMVLFVGGRKHGAEEWVEKSLVSSVFYIYPEKAGDDSPIRPLAAEIYFRRRTKLPDSGCRDLFVLQGLSDAETLLALGYTQKSIDLALSESGNFESLKRSIAEEVTAMVDGDMERRRHHLQNLAAAFMDETGLPPSQVELVEQRNGGETVWFYRWRDSNEPAGKAAE